MNSKKIAIVILATLAVAIGAMQLKRTMDLAGYAKNHSCTWSQTGSFYGDDRDWICK